MCCSELADVMSNETSQRGAQHSGFTVSYDSETHLGTHLTSQSLIKCDKTGPYSCSALQRQARTLTSANYLRKCERAGENDWYVKKNTVCGTYSQNSGVEK